MGGGGLGFQTLEEFNIALLAKQIWRLLRFPDSLLAKVFKGRYYRYCSPLEINVSNRPSYGWKSILAAKALLKSGIRKTIGSGFETSIWTEPWIPDEPARPPKDLGGDRDPLVFVNTLIDFETKKWKIDRLREEFPPEEITLILGIKPSQKVSGDGYSWSLTKSGNYSVKSGYWAARALSRPTCDLPLQGPSVTTLKAQAWKLKTTRKIKHFMWQCISGYLATSQRLYYQHISQDKGCQLCGGERKDDQSTHFECLLARHVWALSDIPSAPGIFPSESLFSNIDYLYERGMEYGADEETLRIFPWIMWYIWKVRNRNIYETVRELPLDILNLATHEGLAWKNANNKEDIPETEDEAEVEESLPTDTPLCYTDASWHSTDRRSGLGWTVITGAKMQLVGLRGLRQCLSPLHVELEALIWAMECLVANSYPAVTFLNDCADLISMAACPEDWPLFVSELRGFLLYRDSCSSFNIRYIPHSENVLADHLAKCARTRGLYFSHVSLVPDWFSFEENH